MDKYPNFAINAAELGVASFGEVLSPCGVDPKTAAELGDALANPQAAW